MYLVGYSCDNQSIQNFAVRVFAVIIMISTDRFRQLICIINLFFKFYNGIMFPELVINPINVFYGFGLGKTGVKPSLLLFSH